MANLPEMISYFLEKPRDKAEKNTQDHSHKYNRPYWQRRSVSPKGEFQNYGLLVIFEKE
ncbi:MAG: hypothetical protein ACYCYP_03920 [Leptospirales bacterium]